MKATLKIKYPHFRAELVSFKDEAATAPVATGERLAVAYAYEGAVLHVYTKFKQAFDARKLDGSLTVPSDTAVLVLRGSVTTGTGLVVKALDYIKPQKTAFSVKGGAHLLLIR